MQLIYFTGVSLFFEVISERFDAFVTSWHELKNSVAVEIGIFAFAVISEQPCLLPHVVECAK
jgi:hypothetical protein